MAENLYFVANSGAVTTAGIAPVNTLTSACVPLQISVPSTRQISIIEYGVSFNGTPAAIHVDLRSTGTTMGGTTASPAVLPYSNPNAPASLCTCLYGTTMGAPAGTVSGYYDTQIISSNTYIKQFPLAREPVAAVSTFVNIVVTSSAAIGCTAYIIWRE